MTMRAPRGAWALRVDKRTDHLHGCGGAAATAEQRCEYARSSSQCPLPAAPLSCTRPHRTRSAHSADAEGVALCAMHWALECDARHWCAHLSRCANRLADARGWSLAERRAFVVAVLRGGDDDGGDGVHSDTVGALGVRDPRQHVRGGDDNNDDDGRDAPPSTLTVPVSRTPPWPYDHAPPPASASSASAATSSCTSSWSAGDDDDDDDDDDSSEDSDLVFIRRFAERARDGGGGGSGANHDPSLPSNGGRANASGDDTESDDWRRTVAEGREFTRWYARRYGTTDASEWLGDESENER